MKNLKLLIIAILCVFIPACSGSSLTKGSPPAGKLFAQVALETVGEHHDFIVEGYEIHLEKAAFVMGNLAFLSSVTNPAMKFHAGEEHEEHAEPESCEFEGSILPYFYVDLLDHPVLPCVTLSEGSYAGLRFEIRPPAEAGEVRGLPSGETSSFVAEGTARKDGLDYPFSIRVGMQSAVDIIHAVTLGAETHHLSLKIDHASWFHGLDFVTLDQEDGIVKIEETHNAEVFEHLKEHFAESFFL